MSDERIESKRSKMLPPLDPTLARLESSFERLGGLVRPGDPFEDPSGPSDDCFSPKKIVNMFFAGATEQDLIHMSRCRICSLKTGRYGQFTDQKLPQPTPEFGLLERMKNIFVSPQQPRAAYCAVLLHLSQPVIGVPAGSDPRVDFSCDLVMEVEGSLPRLHGPSIEVAGPVLATGAKVNSVILAGKEFLRMQFEGATLAEYVRRTLKSHPSVSSTLVIRGHLERSKDLDFQGQATIEFVAK